MRSLQNTSWPVTSAAAQRYIVTPPPSPPARNDSSSIATRGAAAEVLLDAVGDLTGSRDTFGGLPTNSRAVQTWNHKLGSDFMDAFGRPNASLECPCERERKPTVVQSLHLMNSPILQTKLTSPKGRVASWVASTKAPAEVVREIYLAAYARPPEAAEQEAALAHLGREGASKTEAVQDLVWALVNTAEFVFNH